MNDQADKPAAHRLVLEHWGIAGTWWAAAAALLAGAIFWCKGVVYLEQRHPHEDAFILFRYAEHLAHGHGIAFNPGGPPIEGATDFLYLLLLSALVHLGMDVAVAAVWLNALGSALIGFLLARICMSSRTTIESGIIGATIAAAVPFLAGAHASYDGFGTQLYCALILLSYNLYLRPSAAAFICTPYVALLVALFRPDGVIIAAGFCVVTLLTHARSRAARNLLLRHGAITVVLGAAYFIWRYQYFVEALPLPLYVKSRGSERFPGWKTNVDWFKSGNGPGPMLLATAACIVALIIRGKTVVHKHVLGTIPAWLLLAAMTCAFQSQNVDWRFQAPVYTLLMAAMLAAASRLSDSLRRPWLRPIVFLMCATALLPALREGKRIFPLDYMDSFALRLGPMLGNDKVALTEAGRMAYWSDATVFDMVGLNLPHTAKHPPNIAYLADLDPDVVMFHAAGTIDFDRLPIKRGTPNDATVVKLDARRLPSTVEEPYRKYLDDVPLSYGRTDLPTKIAPVVLSAYLAMRRDFDVFAVQYNDSFTHIFGVKRDRPGAPAIKKIVQAAHDLPYLSYAAAKRLPPSWVSIIHNRLKK